MATKYLVTIFDKILRIRFGIFYGYFHSYWIEGRVNLKKQMSSENKKVRNFFKLSLLID